MANSWRTGSLCYLAAKSLRATSAIQIRNLSTLSTPNFYWNWQNVTKKLLLCDNYNFHHVNVREKQTTISEATITLPERPKMPPSPFMMYMKKEIKNCPEMKITEKVKFLAENYRKLSEKEKEPFRKEYDQLLTSFRKNLTSYKENLSDEEMEQIIINRKEKKIKRALAHSNKLAKMELQELGKPKPVGSPFAVFLGRYPEKYGVSLSLREGYNKWKELSEEEKLAYKKITQELTEKYKEDLNVWEQKMIKMGKVNLVRQSSHKFLKIQ